MRIGVFGGTFDPPHLGHLAIAKAAMEQLELDEVLFVPANQNPLKDRRGISHPKVRFEMTALLVEKEEHMAVSDMEITRGGPSYMVDTLDELQMVQPADYWLIMGADSLGSLKDWKSPSRLLRLCRIAVAVRPPILDDVLESAQEEFHDKIDLIEMNPVNASSSEIREKILKNHPVSHLLPPKVLQYIQKQKLYQL